MNGDLRYKAVAARLKELRPHELERLRGALVADKVCLDSVNYDGQHYCPLAVATGLSDTLRQVEGCAEDLGMDFRVTDDLVGMILANRFYPVNALRGVPGTFFHGDHQSRRKDLLGLVKTFLCE